VERVWREANILAVEPGRKHVSVSSRAETFTWFPVGGSLASFRKPPDLAGVIFPPVITDPLEQNSIGLPWGSLD
jgi:hypothetical protein